MAGTVVPNLTIISLCEATTGWTAVGGTNTLIDPTIFDAIQGTYAIQNYNAGAANRGADFDFGIDTNFSDTVIYFWFSFSKVPHATNPMRIRVTDVSGNWREWNIFTKATLPHTAWMAWALKTTVTYDAQSATPPTMTAIRKVGWRIDSVIGKVYIYFDAWRYGTGLTIKLGTEGSPAVLEDFVSAEATEAYGVIQKINEVYFSQGQIIIGSTTVDESTYFKDINQILVFKSIKGNPTGFYEIKGQNAASGTGTTKIFFGTKSGTAGISGCVIKAPSAMKWKLTMSNTNITEFGFYGCIFQNADTTEGQVYSTVKEFLSSNFVACGEMLPNTGIVNKCTFISSPARAIKISSTSHHVTDCQFINCQTAIHHDIGGPVGTPLEYDYDKLMFSGGTYHIENSAVTPNYYINIDRINGSNPDNAKILNSNGGTTVLLAISVHLYLTGLVAGSEIEILEAGTQNELAHAESSGTSFDYQYYYSEGVYIDIIIHKADYEWYFIPNYGPLSQTNASIPVVQRKDRVYSNP